MARPKNAKAYKDSRERLLEVGEEMIRARSYADCGINEILIKAQVPKGSFYHYFNSKEAFGLEVARHYHEKQIAMARARLGDDRQPPLDRLRNYFEMAKAEMQARNHAEGCLMCNLSTELADAMPAFRNELDQHWNELVTELAKCTEIADLNTIGLGHLDSQSAADWLLNAWSGALTRMKACGHDAPLSLFLKTVFHAKDPSNDTA